MADTTRGVAIEYSGIAMFESDSLLSVALTLKFEI